MLRWISLFPLQVRFSQITSCQINIIIIAEIAVTVAYAFAVMSSGVFSFIMRFRLSILGSCWGDFGNFPCKCGFHNHIIIIIIAQTQGRHKARTKVAACSCALLLCRSSFHVFHGLFGYQKTSTYTFVQQILFFHLCCLYRSLASVWSTDTPLSETIDDTKTTNSPMRFHICPHLSL
jgi:hypothetical protein